MKANRLFTKRSKIFTLFFGFCLFLMGTIKAQTVIDITSGTKIVCTFEQKTLTKAEAEAAVTLGYIDLDMIIILPNELAAIASRLTFQPSNFDYWIDNSEVAGFYVNEVMINCPDRKDAEWKLGQVSLRNAENNCPTTAYSGNFTGNGTFSGENYVSSSKTVKIGTIRFKYKKAENFKVYYGDGTNLSPLDQAKGAFNMFFNDQSKICVWKGGESTDADWKKSPYIEQGTTPGGVTVLAGASITAFNVPKQCEGSDFTATVNYTGYTPGASGNELKWQYSADGNTWSDFSVGTPETKETTSTLTISEGDIIMNNLYDKYIRVKISVNGVDAFTTTNYTRLIRKFSKPNLELIVDKTSNTGSLTGSVNPEMCCPTIIESAKPFWIKTTGFNNTQEDGYGGDDGYSILGSDHTTHQIYKSNTSGGLSSATPLRFYNNPAGYFVLADVITSTDMNNGNYERYYKAAYNFTTKAVANKNDEGTCKCDYDQIVSVKVPKVLAKPELSDIVNGCNNLDASITATLTGASADSWEWYAYSTEEEANSNTNGVLLGASTTNVKSITMANNTSVLTILKGFAYSHVRVLYKEAGQKSALSDAKLSTAPSASAAYKAAKVAISLDGSSWSDKKQVSTASTVHLTTTESFGTLAPTNIAVQWQSSSDLGFASYAVEKAFVITGTTGNPPGTANTASTTLGSQSPTKYYRLSFFTPANSTCHMHSNVVELSSPPPSASGNISGLAAICQETSNTYSVTGYIPGSTFLWYYSTDNTNFTAISGATNDYFVFSKTSLGINTYTARIVYFKVAVTPPSATVVETPVFQVDVKAKPSALGITINTVAGNDNFCQGSNISLKLDGYAANAGSIQWQFYNTTLDTWSDISGANGETYLASTTPYNMFGIYKVVLSNTAACTNAEVPQKQVNIISPPSGIETVSPVLNPSPACAGSLVSISHAGIPTPLPADYSVQWQEKTLPSGSWGNVETSKDLSISASTGKAYQAIVSKTATGATCSKTSSILALVTTNVVTCTKPVITPTPSPAVVCSGSNNPVTFSSDVDIMQWEENISSSWVSVTAGTAARLLTVSSSEHSNTGTTPKVRTFRAKSTQGQYSDDFTLTINPVPAEPSIAYPNTSLTHCSGSTTTLKADISSVGASQMDVIWQESADGSTSWASSAGGTLTLSASSGQATYAANATATKYYRVIVTAKNTQGCNKIKLATDNITLTVNPTPSVGAPTITQTPSPVCENAQVVLNTNFTASNANQVEIQWQNNDNSGGWTNLGSASTVNSSAVNVSYTIASASSNQQYRVLATPKNTTTSCSGTQVTGSNFNLSVNALAVMPSFGTQTPGATVNICAPDGASLGFASVSNATTYQWEYSTNSGTSWANAATVASVITIGGATTQTLVLSAVSTTANGYQYRLKATNGSGACAATATSPVFTLNVLAKPGTPSISGLTASQTLCEGSPLNLSLNTSATNTNKLEIQWKEGSTNLGTLITSASSSATATYNIASLTANKTYTAVITASNTMAGFICSASTTTTNVVITSQAKPTATVSGISINTGSTTACEGTALSLTATQSSSGGAATLQWASSADGTSWTNISGANASTYAFTANTTQHKHYKFTVSASNAACAAVSASSSTSFTINKKPAKPSLVADKTQICSDASSFEFNITVSGAETSATPTYVWKNGSTTLDISTMPKLSSSSISGATGTAVIEANATVANYNITLETSLNGCTTVSDPVAVNVLNCGTATIVANFTKACVNGTSPMLTLTLPSVGTVTEIQWLESVDNVAYNKVGGCSASTCVTYSVPVSATATKYYKALVKRTGYPDVRSAFVQIDVVGVNENPNFNPTSAEICQGATQSISASGFNASNYTIQWLDNAANVGTNSATLNYTASVTGAHTLSMKLERKDLAGCSQTYGSIPLTVNPNPAVPTISISPAAVCQGASATLALSSAQTGISSVQWIEGTTPLAAVTNLPSGSTYAYTTGTNTPLGNKSIKVKAINAHGCFTESAATTLTVNQSPAVATGTITTTPAGAICEGDNISFQASVSANNATGYDFQWESSATGSSAWSNVGTNASTYAISSASPTVNKHYRVSVTAKNGSCSATPTVLANKTITVNAKPSLSGVITTQPLATANACQGSSFTLSIDHNAAPVNVSYAIQWYANSSNSNVGGTLISSATNKEYTFTSSAVGTKYYYAVLTATNTLTSCSNTVASQVSAVATLVCSAPELAGPGLASGEDVITCLSFSKKLTATAPEPLPGGSKIQWQSSSDNIAWTSLGSSLDAAVANNKEFSPTASPVGSTYYRAVFTRSGYADIATPSVKYVVKTISENPTITASPVSASQTYCEGATLTLTAGNYGVHTLAWYEGASLLGSGTTLTKSNYSVGSHTVKLILYSADGCTKEVSYIFTIKAKPSLPTGIIPASACQGEAITLNITGTTNAASVQWLVNSTSLSSNNFESSIPKSYTVSSSQVASMPVVLKLRTDAFDGTSYCESEITQNITVNATPAAPTVSSISAGSATCAGSNITLSPTVSGLVGTQEYTWKKGASVVQGPNTTANYIISNATSADNATYTVELRNVSGSCKSGIATKNLVVTVNPLPATSVVSLDPSTLCAGTAGNLQATGGEVGNAGFTFTFKQAGGAALSGTLGMQSVTGTTLTQSYSQATPAALSIIMHTKNDVTNCESSSVAATLNVVTCADPTLGINSATGSSSIDICEDPTNGATAPAGQKLVSSLPTPGTVNQIIWEQGSSTSGPWSTVATYTGSTGTVLAYSISSKGTSYYRATFKRSGYADISTNFVTVNVRGFETPTLALSNNEICEGASTTLSVTGITGSEYTSIQWLDGASNIGTGASYTYTPSLTGARSISLVLTNKYACSRTFGPQTLTVNPKPTATITPLAANVCQASQITLAVTSPQNVASYQWKQGSTNITSATTQSYNYDLPAGLTGSINFSVELSSANACKNTLTTSTIVVAKPNNPSISTQPKNQSICDQSKFDVEVSATADGGANLIYQWKFNGSTPSFGTGANGSKFTVDPASKLLHEGNYKVEIKAQSPTLSTCYSNTINSDEVTISINELPTFTFAPDLGTATVDICLGSKYTFAIDHTSKADETYTYKWFVGNNEIPLATEKTYTLNNVIVGNAGNYKVEVKANKTATSCSKVFTSQVRPITVQTCNGDNITPTTLAFCKDETATAMTVTYDAKLTAPSSVIWQKSNDKNTESSWVDMTAYTANSLTPPTNTSGTMYYRLKVNRVTEGTIYSSVCEVVVYDKPLAPSITSNLANLSVCEGMPASLQITAAKDDASLASETLSYQWYKGSSTIVNTGATLAFAPAALVNEGTYKVEVRTQAAYSGKSCFSDATTSAVATLSVHEKAVKPSTLAINADPSLTPCFGDKLTLKGSHANISTGTNSYRWIVKALAKESSATNEDYVINAVDNTVDNGTYEYRVYNTTANGCKDSASVSVNVNASAKLATTIATVSVPATACEGENLSLSVSASGAGALTYQWLYKANTGDSPTVVSASHNYAINNITSNKSGEYAVKVTQTSGSCSQADTSAYQTMTVNPKPTAPSLSALTGGNFCEGSKETLTVNPMPATAENGAVYTYKWYKNGVQENSKTTNQWSFDPITAADAATYKLDLVSTFAATSCSTVVSSNLVSVVVTNCGGDVISSSVAADAQGRVVICEGAGAPVLTATAASFGGTPTKIKWQSSNAFNGTYSDIALAECNAVSVCTYTLASTATVDTVYYRAQITRSGYPDTYTDVIRYFVNAKPIIPALTALSPVNTTLCAGSDFTISLTPLTVNDATLSYQWKRGATAVGTNSPTFSKTAITLADAGAYSVQVTATHTGNGCVATATSSNAGLTVKKASKGGDVSGVIVSQTCGTSVANNTLTLSSQEGNVLQWEISTDNITFTAYPSGGTATTLNFAAAQRPEPKQALDTTYYIRAQVQSDALCTPAYSQVYALKVYKTPELTSIDPSSITVCENGTGAELKATGVVGTLDWEWSATNGTTGTSVGSSANPYSIPALMASRYYRAKVSNGLCTPITSAWMQVNVKPATATPTISVKIGTDDVSGGICAGSILDFSTSAPASAVSIWEYKAPSGVYTSIANSAGKQSVVFATDALASYGNYDFRVKVQETSCAAVDATISLPIQAQPTAKNIQEIDPVLCLNSLTSTSTLTLAPNSVGTQEWLFEKIPDGTIIKKNNGVLDASFAPQYHSQDTAKQQKYKAKVRFYQASTLHSCTDAYSDEIIVVVSALPKTPMVNFNKTSVCLNENYSVSQAAAPYYLSLQWQEFSQSGSWEDISETATSFTASQSVASTYQYRVVSSIAIANGSNSCVAKVEGAPNSIEVVPAPVLGSLSMNPSNGKTCVNAAITFTVSGASAGASFVWEYSADKITNTTATSSSASYMHTLSNVGKLYVRYKTDNGSCASAWSEWVEVEAFDAPLIEYQTPALNASEICEGEKVEVKVNVANVDFVRIYYSPTAITDVSTLPTNVDYEDIDLNGFVGASEDRTIEFAPANPKAWNLGDNYIMAVALNKEVGQASACYYDFATNPSRLLKVSKKPENGTLAFGDNTKETTQNLGSTVAIKHTTTSPTGTKYVLERVSLAIDAAPDFTSVVASAPQTSTTFSLPITTDFNLISYFRVKSENGSCAPVYSDVIKLNITTPNTGIVELDGSTTSPICITETIQLKAGPAAELSNFSNIQWEYKLDNEEWAAISSMSGTTASFTALSEGIYDFRYTYSYQGSLMEDTSALATVEVSAESGKGVIRILQEDAGETTTNICVGSSEIRGLQAQNTVGEVQRWEFSKNKSAWTSRSVAGAADPSYFEAIPVLPDSGYFRVVLKNGACAEIASDPVLVNVFHAVKGGTVSVPQNPICYNTSVKASLAGYNGAISEWIFADNKFGPYTSLSNTTKDNTFSNLTGKTWVAALVGDGVCGTTSSDTLAIKVYDEPKITQQPTDVVGVNQTVVFTVQAGGMGHLNCEPIAGFTYEWFADSLGNWVKISEYANVSNFTGYNTAKLSVNEQQYNINPNVKYRCEVAFISCATTKITSNEVKVIKGTPFVPGNLEAGSQKGCFFNGDTAVYFVSGTQGEAPISYTWLLKHTDGTETSIETPPGLLLYMSAKGDTIKLLVDETAGYFAGDYSVKVVVRDALNTGSLNTMLKTLCASGMPTVSDLEDQTVCESEMAEFVIDLGTDGPPDLSANYKWYIKKRGGSFVEITSAGLSAGMPYEGATIKTSGTSNSLKVTNTTPALDSAVVKVEVFTNYNVGVFVTSTAILRVKTKASFGPGSTPPAATTVCENTALIMSAVANGDDLRYQWQKLNTVSASWEDVIGQTAAMLSIASAKPSDAGRYRLGVTNDCMNNNWVYSTDAEATVNALPNILPADLQNISQCENGAEVVFNPVLKDNTSWTLKDWYKGATALGLSTNTLTISSPSISDTGTYFVELETSALCVTESPIKVKVGSLTIFQKPIIATQPTSPVFTAEFGAAAFTVSVENENVPNLTYSWFKKSAAEADFVEISTLGTPYVTDTFANYNSASLQVLSASMAMDNTKFYCLVSNDCGDTKSNEAILRVGGILQDLSHDTVCQNADALFEAKLSTDPTTYVFQARTTAAGAWTDISAGNVPGVTASQYTINKVVGASEVSLALGVTAAATAMNGYEFQLIVNLGRPDEMILGPVSLTVIEKITKLQLNANRDTVILDLSGEESALLAALVTPATAKIASYDWSEKAPEATDFTLQQSGSDKQYTFSPADTGTYVYRLKTTQWACGMDSVEKSISVIRKVKAQDLSIEMKNPSNEQVIDDMDIADEKDTSKPNTEQTITFEACEDMKVVFALPGATGSFVSSQWQVKTAGSTTWTNITTAAPYTVYKDSLVLNPLPFDFDANVYRFIAKASNDKANDTSVSIQLKVSLGKSLVAKMSITPNEGDSISKVNPNDNVTLNVSMENASTAEYTSYTWYRVFPSSAGMTTEEIAGSPTVSPSISFNANLAAKHDSTTYYCEIKNACGLALKSDTSYALRIYQKITIEWDTTKYENSPFVDFVAADSSVIEVCAGEALVSVTAKIKVGVADKYIWEKSNTGLNGSWSVIQKGIDYDITNNTLTIFNLDETKNNLKYRCIAEVTNNKQLNDTIISLLTLHIVDAPTLGVIELLPAGSSLCEGASVSFKTTASTADPIQWFLKREGQAAESVGDGSDTYLHGVLNIVDDKALVYAISSNLCGKDSVAYVMEVKQPVDVSVSFAVDTLRICLGSEVSLTAIPTNEGDLPTYEWFVDGTPATDQDTKVFTKLFETEGEYWVKLLLTSSESCVNLATAVDSVQIIVGKAPELQISTTPEELTEVEANTVIELNAVLSGGASPITYAWTPADLVENTSALTTNTLPLLAGEYVFKFTATDANACFVSDSVSVKVKTALRLDSLGILATFEDMPDGGVDTTHQWNIVNVNDTIDLKLCYGEYVSINFHVSGGEAPVNFFFSPSDYLVRPLEYNKNTGLDDVYTYTFKVDEEEMNIEFIISDATGNQIKGLLRLTTFPRAKEAMLMTTPKMPNNRYYENQIIRFHVVPAAFENYDFYKFANHRPTAIGGGPNQSGPQPVFETMFKRDEKNNSVEVIMSDKNNCKRADKEEVEIVNLPNVIAVGEGYVGDEVIFPSFDIEVFNAWGQRIVKKGDRKGWDGKVRGKNVVSGTYYYTVFIPTMDGKTIEVKSAVTVMSKNKN